VAIATKNKLAVIKLGLASNGRPSMNVPGYLTKTNGHEPYSKKHY